MAGVKQSHGFTSFFYEISHFVKHVSSYSAIGKKQHKCCLSYRHVIGRRWATSIRYKNMFSKVPLHLEFALRDFRWLISDL